MYAVLLKNPEPMTADLCILRGTGMSEPEVHVRVTNVGTPCLSNPNGTLDGCLTEESRVHECDGKECEGRLVERKVLTLNPPFDEQVEALLASFGK